MPIPDGTVDIIKLKNGVVTTYKWIRDSWARKKIVALQQAIAAIVVPTKTSQLQNDSGFITSADVPPGSTASSTTPLMDGTAAVGTENAFARGDHRHPTDTSRQAALSASQLAAVNSGVTAAKVAEWDGITVPTKTSELTNDSGFITSSSVPSAYTSNPRMDGTASAGSSTAWARGDHVHPSDTSKADVSAIPTATSQLTNDSGYITSAKFAVITGTIASTAGWSAFPALPSGFTYDNSVVLSLAVYTSGSWRMGEGIVSGSEQLFCRYVGSGVAVYNSSSTLFGVAWKATLMRVDI